MVSVAAEDTSKGNDGVDSLAVSSGGPARRRTTSGFRLGVRQFAWVLTSGLCVFW